jgi:hypothetical protein
MDNIQIGILRDEFEKAIESGEIVNAPKEKFNQWLLALSTGTVSTTAIQQNFIIRGIALNHFRTEQVITRLEETIKNLNAANDRSQKTITYLTIIATILAAIATIATVFQAISIFSN